MKWLKRSFIDSVIALSLTAVHYFLLHGSIFSSAFVRQEVWLFLSMLLLSFNIHFFVIYLWKSWCIGVVPAIGKLLERIEQKDIAELEQRLPRIKTVLSEAVMLVENPTPGPKAITVLNSAVQASQKNLCAVSSKNIFLWEDSTFLFYFMLSGLINIERRNKSTGTDRYSMTLDTNKLNTFVREEKEILAKLAHGQDVAYFYVLRFLIYPLKTYQEMSEPTLQLLRAHWLFGVHCIPLVCEEIEKLLNDETRKRVSSLSRVVEMGSNNKMPDFLLIDNATNKANSSCLCYYDNNGQSRIKTSESDFSQAREIFQTLSNLAVNNPKQAIWINYGILQHAQYGLGTFKQ